MRLGSRGVYKSAKGDSYDGCLKDGLFDGEGTYTWANGEKYIGQYSKGLKEGKGTYHWAKPECYFEGSWTQGKPSGHGKYSTETKVVLGYWRNGNIISTFSTAYKNPEAQNEPTKVNVPTQKEVSLKNLPHLEGYVESSNQSSNSGISQPAKFDKVLLGNLINFEALEKKENAGDSSTPITNLDLNQNLNLKQENKENIPLENKLVNMSSPITIENKLEQAPNQLSQQINVANGTTTK